MLRELGSGGAGRGHPIEDPTISHVLLPLISLRRGRKVCPNVGFYGTLPDRLLQNGKQASST